LAAVSTRSRCTGDSPATSSQPAALVTGTPTTSGTTPGSGRSGSRQVRVGAAALSRTTEATSAVGVNRFGRQPRATSTRTSARLVSGRGKRP
jgi:hypothetical protein